MIITRFLILTHAVGSDIPGEVRFEHCAEFRQVQMAVDAAELVIGLQHPDRALEVPPVNSSGMPGRAKP